MSLHIALKPKYNLPVYDHINCHIAGSHTRIDKKQEMNFEK